MDLSIIIVNWNSKAHVDRCIASIVASATAQLAYEIVVIDAGSYDGIREVLQHNYPHVRFIESEKNLGFGRANNQAFLASKGTCVVFLNPDTEVVGSALRTMFDEIHRLSRAGAVGC